MGFSKIATGNDFVIGILDGFVTVFGSNSVVKQDLTIITDAVEVYAADDIAFAIRADGSLAGFGSTREERLPISVALDKVKQVSICPDCVVCIEESGALKAWGRGASRIPPELLTSKVVSISNQIYDITLVLDSGQLYQFNLRS